jgi:dihydrofolate synthase / folylpolyglutamate synthase
MTYSEAITFLYSLRLFGTKLGLENTFALAKLRGNPQDSLRFIHVAGTNGKGSVCAMLESIYRHAGLRVGLFTSPHLISFTERIQVNRQPIPEETVSRLAEILMRDLGAEPDSWPFRPTFFEFITVLALIYFLEQRCDLVIWETGMGGRLDATNIVAPLASVITNIQFDHEQWLGHSLAEIAHEKAGIIKAHVPCITAVEPGEALDVICETARLNNSSLRVITRPFLDPRIARRSLLGEHQEANAMLAVATVDALQKAIAVSNDSIEKGLANTSWPGRLQLIRRGENSFLLDGAHNPDGARALARALEQYFAKEEITLILGVFKDKEWQTMCRILVPKVVRVFVVPVQSERSANPEEVRDFCKREWPQVVFRAFASCAQALDATLNYPFVVVAGSLHLVGEALEHLGLSRSARAERELNEWDAARNQKHQEP